MIAYANGVTETNQFVEPLTLPIRPPSPQTLSIPGKNTSTETRHESATLQLHFRAVSSFLTNDDIHSTGAVGRGYSGERDGRVQGMEP